MAFSPGVLSIHASRPWVFDYGVGQAQHQGDHRQLEAEGHEVVYSDTDSIFVRSPVAEGAPSSV